MAALIVSKYPLNADGTPLDLEVGVVTDATGNGGARFTAQPLGPDRAPLPIKGIVLVDKDGNPYGQTSVGNSAPTVPQAFYQPTDPDMQNAIQGALNSVRDLATSGYGYGKGAHSVMLPQSQTAYTIHDTLELTYSDHVYGETRAGASGGASVLVMTDPTKTIFRGQSYNTTGASGPSITGTGYPGGNMAEVHNLLIQGAFAGTEYEAHAFDFRVKMHIHDNIILNIPGDHFFASVSATSGLREGNANDSRVYRNFCQSGRRMVYWNGLDVNSTSFRDNDGILNRMWGYAIDNIIGCNIYGGDLSSNGQVAGWPCTVTFNSNWYDAIAGQEVWCKNNAPSGTTANNQGWAYRSAGYVAAERPAYDGAHNTNYRAGGSVYVNGNSNYNHIAAIYTETDQGPPQIDNCGTQWYCPLAAIPMLNAGGAWDGAPYGGQLIGGSSFMRGPRSLASGDTTVRGQVSFTESIGEVFRYRPIGGAPHVYADYGGGELAFRDSNGHTFFYLETANGRVGFLDLINQLNVNGNKVVGARGARGTASLADVVALLDAWQAWA